MNLNPHTQEALVKSFYFDTDGNTSADFAIYLYSDVLTVRGPEPGTPGLYSVELGQYTYQIENGYLSFSVPSITFWHFTEKNLDISSLKRALLHIQPRV